MKNTLASLVGLTLVVVVGAGLSRASAAPEQVGAAQMQIQVHGSSHSSIDGGPLAHADLNINGVRLGMSRSELAGLHLQKYQWPNDLKYGHTARVTFVVGGSLQNGDRSLGIGDDPIQALHTWGKPMVSGMCGENMVYGYRSGQAIVIMRYRPARLDSRGGAGGEIALSSDLAWVPADWGHAMLERAGF